MGEKIVYIDYNVLTNEERLKYFSGNTEEKKTKIPELLLYNNPEINPAIIKKIKTIYKSELSGYKYSDKTKVKKGQIIRYISLDFDEISIPCLLREIEYTPKGNINNFVVSNNLTGNVWRIKPNKYYLFILSGSKMSRMLQKEVF